MGTLAADIVTGWLIVGLVVAVLSTPTTGLPQQQQFGKKCL